MRGRMNTTILKTSQSLWSRDGFSIDDALELEQKKKKSQSLWSRDGFSIEQCLLACPRQRVGIPLEQGRFFNRSQGCYSVCFQPPKTPCRSRAGSEPDVRYHGLWQTIALKVLYGVFLIFFLLLQNFSKPLLLKPGSSYSAITLRTAHCALFSSQYSSRFL